MKAIIRKDEQAVSPVIATILMVAITVVLAAVLYVMVSGLLTGPGPSKPFVTFSSVTKSNAATWTFTVASASPAVAPSNYKVNFAIGGTAGTAQNMGASGTNVTSMATTPNVGVKWTDIGGEGTVNAGDVFTITFVWGSQPTSGTAMTFYLLYSDGSQIQTQAWTA